MDKVIESSDLGNHQAVERNYLFWNTDKKLQSVYVKI